MKLYINIALFSLFILLMSCEQIIDIDLNDANPQLVIEGFISSNPTQDQYVKLSLTTGYLEEDAPPPITNAVVIVSEDDILIDTFSQQYAGYYVSNTLLSGKVGSTYKLRVYYNGVLYEATTTMQEVSPLDSLTAYYYNEQGATYEKEGYYVTIYTQEPEGKGDYYQWLYYTNDELDQEELIFASDELVDGIYINNIEFPYSQEQGDTVRVEQYSITEAGFEFLRVLESQESFGDLFDTPPANIVGNISNNGLGFFNASDVSIYELIIEP